MHTLKFINLLLAGILAALLFSCSDDDPGPNPFIGTFINQTDDCAENGYVLNITPLEGEEVNLTGIANIPSLIIKGTREGNKLNLTTTTVSGVTIGGNAVLIDDILTVNYTLAGNGGSGVCTGIFNIQ